MSPEALFEPLSPVASGTELAAQQQRHPRRGGEFLLLAVLVVIAVANCVLALTYSVAGWIASYLMVVVVGVPALGFHTQAVMRRFEILGRAVTSSSKFLRVVLVVVLVAPALVSATRLAVEWSA